MKWLGIVLLAMNLFALWHFVWMFVKSNRKRHDIFGYVMAWSLLLAQSIYNGWYVVKEFLG